MAMKRTCLDPLPQTCGSRVGLHKKDPAPGEQFLLWKEVSPVPGSCLHVPGTPRSARPLLRQGPGHAQMAGINFQSTKVNPVIFSVALRIYRGATGYQGWPTGELADSSQTVLSNSPDRAARITAKGHGSTSPHLELQLFLLPHCHPTVSHSIFSVDLHVWF